MTMTHTISWEHNDDILPDIVTAIEEGMGEYSEPRSWLTLIIEYYAGVSVFTLDDYLKRGISITGLSGRWDQADRIMRKHIEAAAEEIRQLSLTKKDHDNE